MFPYWKSRPCLFNSVSHNAKFPLPLHLTSSIPENELLFKTVLLKVCLSTNPQGQSASLTKSEAHLQKQALRALLGLFVRD